MKLLRRMKTFKRLLYDTQNIILLTYGILLTAMIFIIVKIDSANNFDCVCLDKHYFALKHNNRNHWQPNHPLYNGGIIIFVITPTYVRATQRADLIRLAQTLRLVPNVFWIVVEDATFQYKFIQNLLKRSDIPYVHLLGPKPRYDSGRGVSNRLKAFEWLRENYANSQQQGVIYLADDDNTYDVRLFEEMRSTRIVSMFPVGGIGDYGVSSPVVDRQSGKIIGIHDSFVFGRKYLVDMAGFAVNLQYFLKQKQATMEYEVGKQEESFLTSLGVKMWQLEPKANNCTDILVWHTKTYPFEPLKPENMQMFANFNSTYLPHLYLSSVSEDS